MRVLAFASAVLLVCGQPAAAQVAFDLSSVGSVSQTLNPGDVSVVVQNKLPTVRYDISVRRETIPIAALAAEGIGDLAVRRGESALKDPCEGLTEAATALQQATTESEVPSRRAVLEALLAKGQCTRPDVEAPARTLVAATSQTFGPYTLKRGERLIVTISRPAPEGQTVTWTLTLSTEPRGEWLTMFGVSLFPNRDDHFVTKAVEGGGFRVVDNDPGWSLDVPTASVYFSWLSAKQRHRDWTWGPSVGLGLSGTSLSVSGGIAINYNQNIGFVLGVGVTSQEKLRGRYRDDPNVPENLEEDQLHDTVYRPMPMVAVTLRFDRNPFKKEEQPAAAPAAAPAAPAPSKPKPPATPAGGANTTPSPATPDAPSGATPEASRDSDVKLRFDAKGAFRDPAQINALVAAASKATDVYIVSHGWWNDEATADCFYKRIVGGIARATPGYLSDNRYRPLFVTVYWPSALFPMEPGDCRADPRTEASRPTPLSFTPELVRGWATAAFPGAASTTAFSKEADRLATLLERERTSSLPDRDADELAGILVRWRSATDATGTPEEGLESSTFAGTGAQAAERWRERPDMRAEFSLPGLDAAKKWLNYGNAFTFWTMKERAGTVGSKGLYEVVKALQPLRTRATDRVRVHLIGHSFGGKVVTASLTGAGAQLNHVDSLIILQGAFSQFAFATRDEIRSTGVTIDRPGLYNAVVGSRLVENPIVVTHSSADVPNRLLYPAGVMIVNDVTEASRSPRFGSLGANGIRGARSSPMNLALQTIANLEAQSPRAISVDASSVILGHSDLIKPQVFKLIWDTIELNR